MTKKWDIVSPPELAGEVVTGETMIAARAAARDLVMKKKFRPTKRLEVLRRLGVKEQAPPAPPAPKPAPLVRSVKDIDGDHVRYEAKPRKRASARRETARKPTARGVPVIDLRAAPPPAPDASRWGLTDCEPLGEPIVGLGTGRKGSAIVVDHSYAKSPQGLDFRSARVSAGISLGAAAIKLGLSVSQVSGLETGRHKPKDWAAITKAMLA